MKPFLFLLLGIVIQSQANAIVPFDTAHWQIRAQEAVTDSFDGQKCLRLIQGTMTLKDHSFVNGIIDFDIAFPGERCFPGISFRMQDTANGEVYYLRPHQSGNPDAMQYYPEYNGGEGWQLYGGEGFIKAHILPFDQWLHVHMLIKGSRAEIYFNGEKDPALYIHSLKRPVAPGAIILSNTSQVMVRFANFSYRKTEDLEFTSVPRPFAPLPAGIFTNWQVSSPFDEKKLADKPLLDLAGLPALSWQKLTTTEEGIADLSQLSGRTPSRNTVFARLVIHAATQGVKKFSFGFSDRVKVYFNKRLLFSGENNYRSRDYRFLGTIGFFDAVYLPLEKGDNEVWMAVSEDFGGWGVEARIEDL